MLPPLAADPIAIAVEPVGVDADHIHGPIDIGAIEVIVRRHGGSPEPECARVYGAGVCGVVLAGMVIPGVVAEGEDLVVVL